MSMSDDASMPLPELRQRIASLADDLEAAGCPADALEPSALLTAVSVRWGKLATELRPLRDDQSGAVITGGWEGVRRDPAKLSIDERKHKSTFWQAIVVLQNLRNKGQSADTVKNLRKIAQSLAPDQDQAKPGSVTVPTLRGRYADKKRKFIDHLNEPLHVNDSDRQIEEAGICTKKTAARWRVELADDLPAVEAVPKGKRGRTVSIEACGVDAAADKAARKF